MILDVINKITFLGFTVSFKKETTNLSVRVSTKVNENTIKSWHTVLPFDNQHALNERRVVDAIQFGYEKCKQ